VSVVERSNALVMSLAREKYRRLLNIVHDPSEDLLQARPIPSELLSFTSRMENKNNGDVRYKPNRNPLHQRREARCHRGSHDSNPNRVDQSDDPLQTIISN